MNTSSRWVHVSTGRRIESARREFLEGGLIRDRTMVAKGPQRFRPRFRRNAAWRRAIPPPAFDIMMHKANIVMHENHGHDS